MIHPEKTAIKPPKVLNQTRGRPKKKSGHPMPDLNQPFKVPQPLQKSRSMHTQISRNEVPKRDLVAESARHSSYIFKAEPPPQKDQVHDEGRYSSYDLSEWTIGSQSLRDIPSPHRQSEQNLSQWIIGSRSLRDIPSPPRQGEHNLSQWLFGSQEQSTNMWVRDIPSSSRHSSYIPIQPSNNMPYLDEIPKEFHPYITRVVNVDSDGNCGFRALAVAMGYKDTDENCEMVRNEMLAEYISRKGFYDAIFKKGDNIYRNISVSLLPRPMGYWMQTPEAGVLLANRLGCIVVCLALSGSTTVFPFEKSPEQCEPHRTFTIASVWRGQHYVMVELSNNSPLPTITPYWANRDQAASRWEVIYQDRLHHYRQLTYRPPEYANIESSQSTFY